MKPQWPHRSTLCTVPAGESGSWSVRHFAVSKTDVVWQLCTSSSRSVPEGTYTGIYRGEQVIMSEVGPLLGGGASVIRWALLLGIVVVVALALHDVYAAAGLSW